MGAVKKRTLDRGGVQRKERDSVRTCLCAFLGEARGGFFALFDSVRTRKHGWCRTGGWLAGLVSDFCGSNDCLGLRLTSSFEELWKAPSVLFGFSWLVM